MTCPVAEKHYLRMLTFASGPLSMFDHFTQRAAPRSHAPAAPNPGPRVSSCQISPDAYHLINRDVSFHHLYLLSLIPLDGVVSIGKNSATPPATEPVLTWPPPLADNVNFVVLSVGSSLSSVAQYSVLSIFRHIPEKRFFLPDPSKPEDVETCLCAVAKGLAWLGRDGVSPIDFGN